MLQTKHEIVINESLFRRDPETGAFLLDQNGLRILKDQNTRLTCWALGLNDSGKQEHCGAIVVFVAPSRHAPKGYLKHLEPKERD